MDALNRDELLALTSEAVRFQAQDTGHVDALKTSCPVSALPCPELVPPGYIALPNLLQKKMPFTDMISSGMRITGQDRLLLAPSKNCLFIAKAAQWPLSSSLELPGRPPTQHQTMICKSSLSL